MHKIVIVIPAYNEASQIAGVIRGLPKSISGYPVTTVVVDDGSVDDTARIAIEAGAHTIRHIINGGAGAATSTGIEFGKTDGATVIGTMDADGQHLAEDMVRVIEAVLNGKGDLVLGSRLINYKGMPWFRVLGNKGLSLITYMLFGIRVTDSQSGMKAFSPKALAAIKIRSRGMEFCSEILWRSKQKKILVIEIPIKAIYTDYSMAKGQSNWNALNIIRSLIRRKVLEFIHG